MTTTSILGITEPAANQNQKEQTISNALEALAVAGNGSYSITFTANAYTLTALQFTRAIYFLAGSLSGTGALTVPLTKRYFVVNNSASGHDLTVGGATGGAVTIASGDLGIIYCDGTDCWSLGGASGGGSAVSLSAANTWTAAQRGAVVTLTDAATIATDLALGNNFTVTLGGNRTLGNPTNTTAGQAGQIVVKQDGTGSRTLAFGSQWKFPNGSAPTMTTTASATDILSYYVIDSTHIAVSTGLKFS